MTKFCYKEATEETLFIDLPGSGGLKIKGILRGSFDQPLAVIIHGRPGSGNELLQYLGARYLYELGFASLRLSMYDFSVNTRNLVDCTLDTHAQDFSTVIDYVHSRGTKQVFGIGHSYGGATILKSDAELDGAVLWDPTHFSYWQEHPEPDPNFPEEIVGDLVITMTGYGFITPLAAREYDHNLGDSSTWARGKGYPLEIISAGQGGMAHLGKRYIDFADEPKKHVIINDAHHQFEDSDKVMSQLFEETTNWLKGLVDD